MSPLETVILLLAVAVIAVPLAKWLGLGSIIGYVAAGAVVGPAGLALITDVEEIGELAVLGVDFLLFLIGLELQPSRLWAMRKSVFGLGSAQLGITTVLLTAIGMSFNLDFAVALLIGAALSLSSTAFGLQILSETKQINTRHGRTAFSILLFQDLAAVPILAAIPLIAAAEVDTGHGGGISNPFLGAAVALGALALVIVAGRTVLQPVYRAVAAANVREVFVAVALLTILGAGYLLEEAGLSMALGAFLAGVLLSDSAYRHALEADIDPFKGLLLGLFFLTVGMNVDIGFLTREPATIIGAAAGLLALKAAVLFALGRWSGLNGASAKGLAIAISQGGEFGFVIFALASGTGLIDADISGRLVLIVTLSMLATPLLFALDRALPKGDEDGPETVPPMEENQVIIAGFGRFGQIVGRLLRARKIPFTALEASADQVDFVARFGNKIYSGDASRLDLLRAAGAEHAKLFVLAIDDVDASLRAAELVREHFPHLMVYARARNREHAYRLMELGIDKIYRETFGSGLEAAGDVLKGLGFSEGESARSVALFRADDEARLKAQLDHYTDLDRMAKETRTWSRELEELFEKDAAEDEAP